MLLAETAGLALRLHKGQDVTLADRADHVADDRAAGVVEELDADLRALTTRAGAAENLLNLSELDGWEKEASVSQVTMAWAR